MKTMNRKTRIAAGALAGVAVVAGLAALAEAREGAAPAWGPVLTLREAGASNPTVAVDPRGDGGYVAWVETAEGVSNVVVSRLSSDGSPAAPVRANDRPGDAAPHEQAPAQVAVGPEGNVYVLWQNSTAIPGRRFPASDLRFARSTDGGRTFEPAVTVNDDAGGRPSSHTFHDVLVAPDGTVWVSWLDSRVRDAERARRNPDPAPSSSSAESIGSTESRSSGSGSTGSTVSRSTESRSTGSGSTGSTASRSTESRSTGPHSGQAKGGHGGGMKEDPTLPGAEIRVARSTDGGKTFGPSLVVDGGVCPCCRTSLAVGADGSLYVAWRKVFAGDVRDVVVARLAPGAAAFSAPATVHDDRWVFNACPHAGPSVAVDVRGRLHVAWYTGKDGRQGLWHAVSADGGRTFAAPKPLLAGAWVPPSQVKLAADGDGVLAAWDDRRAADGALTVARLRADGPGSPQTVPGGRSPALDLRAGAGLLAWHQGESVRVRRLGGD